MSLNAPAAVYGEAIQQINTEWSPIPNVTAPNTITLLSTIVHFSGTIVPLHQYTIQNIIWW